MPKISTDSKMDFDRSVSTENRFALRNWLEGLVKAINYNDRNAYRHMLGENLIVEGFSDGPMDHETYFMFLQQRGKQKVIRVVRYPELAIRCKNSHYYISGRYEEFFNGILSYEGNIEMILVKGEEGFKLVSQIFYPRLKVSYEKTDV
jgi:hypothetical protein